MNPSELSRGFGLMTDRRPDSSRSNIRSESKDVRDYLRAEVGDESGIFPCVITTRPPYGKRKIDGGRTVRHVSRAHNHYKLALWELSFILSGSWMKSQCITDLLWSCSKMTSGIWKKMTVMQDQKQRIIEFSNFMLYFYFISNMRPKGIETGNH